MKIRKDTLYILTLLSLALIIITGNYFTIEYLYNISKKNLLHNQFESSIREAKEIANLLEKQLQQGINENIVIQNLQAAIENGKVDKNFICMYDTLGVELCHPNRERIGKLVDSNSVVYSLGEVSEQTFQDIILSGKDGGGLRMFNDKNSSSEIIYAQRIPSKPWMVASHANLSIIKAQLDSQRDQFLLIQIISSLLIIFLSFLSTRWISSKYENQIEFEKDALAKEMLNLAALNNELMNHQKQISINSSDKETIGKQRILIHWRDQIIPVAVEDISYFHTSNSLTYIYCNDKNVYHSNSSLEELYNQIDNELFFRANRQYLVSINSIKKIYRHGNNQLKLEIYPQPPEDLIISKNRISEFRDWLSS